jgi:hypothetical protein
MGTNHQKGRRVRRLADQNTHHPKGRALSRPFFWLLFQSDLVYKARGLGWLGA